MGVEPADGGIPVVDAQVRNPQVSRVGRVADRHLPAVFRKQHRQNLQRLILFFRQAQVRPFVHFERPVFISSVERGRADIGVPAEGQGVRIVGKAAELLRDLRVFLQNVGNESADAAIQHDHDDVFSLPRQREGRRLLFRLPVRSRLQRSTFFPNAVDIQRGQHTQADARRQARQLQDILSFFPQEKHQPRQSQHRAQVQQALGERHGQRRVILQRRRKIAVSLSEEQVIRDSRRRGRREEGREPAPAPSGGQPEQKHEPDQEGSRSRHRGKKHVAQRGLKGPDHHKLSRGSADHRGRDQHPQQHRQQHAAAAENLARGPVLLRITPGGPVGLPEGFRGAVRRLQAFSRAFCVSAALGGRVRPQTLRRAFLRLIRNLPQQILHQGESIVQRPVQGQAGGRSVKQHEENQRHAVELKAFPPRQAPGIDRSGDDADERHQHGEQVNGRAAQHDQGVRLPQIPDRPEGRTLQQAQPRQIAVGGHKKRNLQQQGQGSPQHASVRLVAVLPVVGLQHHEALVAPEGPFDLLNPRLQQRRLLTFLLLNPVRPAVDRQHHQIHGQTQQHNGKPRAPRHPEAQGVHCVKQQLQRSKDQPVQYLRNHRVKPFILFPGGVPPESC